MIEGDPDVAVVTGVLLTRMEDLGGCRAEKVGAVFKDEELSTFPQRWFEAGVLVADKGGDLCAEGGEMVPVDIDGIRVRLLHPAQPLSVGEDHLWRRRKVTLSPHREVDGETERGKTTPLRTMGTILIQETGKLLAHFVCQLVADLGGGESAPLLLVLACVHLALFLLHCLVVALRHVSLVLHPQPVIPCGGRHYARSLSGMGVDVSYLGDCRVDPG